MKKNNCKRQFSILTILLVLVCSAFAIQAQGKNVLDYYKMTPSNMLANKSMRANIVVKDIKNGYLKIEGAMEGWVEVALFRKKNKSPVLVVGETGCGPVCGTDLYIYQLVRGKMVNTTKKLMPEISEKELKAKYLRKIKGSEDGFYGGTYELPRKGKTIRLVNDSGEETLFGITWKNDKFVVDRSVLDLYYIHPFNIFNSEYAQDKVKILVNDEKNGYLKIKIPTATIEVGLFRKTNRMPVLLVIENYCGTGRCATSEMQAAEFANGEWNIISEQIFPDEAALEKRIHSKSAFANKYGYQYKVPRYGTTINIVEGSDGKTIYKLVWKNNKFLVVQ